MLGNTFGSGDSEPADGVAGGFVDLFPTAHLWYGDNDMVGWRNLNIIRIGSLVKSTGKVSVRLDYHSFRLTDKADGVNRVARMRTVAMLIRGGIGYMFAGPSLDANSPGSGNTFTFLFGGCKF